MKLNSSKPDIFMYIVIGIMLVTVSIYFVLSYG